ncbi:MAG: methyltransferase domain-containing protein [Acidimicrobiales bacterium]|jgi:SAM-dependent methyltransferase
MDAVGAPEREWTTARLWNALRQLRDPAFVKRRWQLRVVKPRYGVEAVRDLVIDERYGGRCGGTYASRWNDKGYRGTSSAHYYYLKKLFADHNISIGPDDVLVDVGCGKGRVLNFWLHKGLRNRMVGIEIDERWAGYTAKRLAGFANVEVLCGDAFELMPRDGTVFFIFNPFTRETTERFKSLLENLRGPGEDITLVYYMCNYDDLFESDPRWDVARVTDNTFHPSIVARLSKTADRIG